MKLSTPYPRVYLKRRKYLLFLQTQLDFALKSLGIHKGFQGSLPYILLVFAKYAMLFTNVYAPRPTTPPTATPTPKPETPVVHPTPEPTPVTRVLIQTGQLNWPIPVLGGLAVVLVVVGVALTRKKAKKHDEE